MYKNTGGKSVFKRGADDGFWFGLYLSLMWILICVSVSSLLASLVSFAMIIAVPFVIYRFLKRGYKADNCSTSFAGLSLHGICIFFFGSLLMAATCYVYLRFFNPMFLPGLFDSLIELYSAVNTPEAATMVQAIEDIRHNALPTAGMVAVELIWLGLLSGFILSIIVSLIVRAAVKPPQPPKFPGE